MSHHALIVTVRMAKQWTKDRRAQGFTKDDIKRHAAKYKDNRIANGCEVEVAIAIERAFTDGL